MHRMITKLPRLKPYGVDIDFQNPTSIQDRDESWEFDYDEELNMRLFIGDFEEYKEKLSERLEEILELLGKEVQIKVNVRAYDEERGYDIRVEVEKEDEDWYAILPDGEEVYLGEIETKRNLYDEFIVENYSDLFDDIYREHMSGIRTAEFVFAVPNPSIEMEKLILDRVEKDALSSLLAANEEEIEKAARQTGGSCFVENNVLSCEIYTESERYPYIIVYVS